MPKCGSTYEGCDDHFCRRLGRERLEGQIEPQDDLRPWRIANALYERHRRFAEAAGCPFEDVPRQLGEAGPHFSIAERFDRPREQVAKLPKDPLLANAARNRYR